MKNNYTRRIFIKITSVTAVGTSFLLSPLKLLANPIRKFTKKGQYNFFTSDDPNARIFVYTEDNFVSEHSEFQIEKAFTSDYSPYKFIIVFYKESLDFNSYELKEICRRKLEGKKILWFSSNIDSLPNIQFDNNNNLLKSFDISFLNQSRADVSIPDILIDNEVGTIGKIIYDSNLDSFILSASTGRFTFFANNQRAFFDKLEIRLSNTSQAVDSPTQIKNNIGSLRFKTTEFNATDNKTIPIKPYSPYILNQNNKSIPL